MIIEKAYKNVCGYRYKCAGFCIAQRRIKSKKDYRFEFQDKIIPNITHEILSEYKEVLKRKKYVFDKVLNVH